MPVEPFTEADIAYLKRNYPESWEQRIKQRDGELAFQAKMASYMDRAARAHFAKVPFDEPSPATGWVSPLYNVLEFGISATTPTGEIMRRQATGKVIFMTSHGYKVSLSDADFAWVQEVTGTKKPKGGRVIYLHDSDPRKRRRDLEPMA